MAIKAKSCFAASNDWTVFDSATAAAFGFIPYINLIPTPLALIFLSLVSYTKPAIHTARSNQHFSHFLHLTPHYRITQLLSLSTFPNQSAHNKAADRQVIALHKLL